MARTENQVNSETGVREALVLLPNLEENQKPYNLIIIKGFVTSHSITNETRLNNDPLITHSFQLITYDKLGNAKSYPFRFFMSGKSFSGSLKNGDKIVVNYNEVFNKTKKGIFITQVKNLTENANFYVDNSISGLSTHSLNLFERHIAKSYDFVGEVVRFQTREEPRIIGHPVKIWSLRIKSLSGHRVIGKSDSFPDNTFLKGFVRRAGGRWDSATEDPDIILTPPINNNQGIIEASDESFPKEYEIELKGDTFLGSIFEGDVVAFNNPLPKTDQVQSVYNFTTYTTVSGQPSFSWDKLEYTLALVFFIISLFIGIHYVLIGLIGNRIANLGGIYWFDISLIGILFIVFGYFWQHRKELYDVGVHIGISNASLGSIIMIVILQVLTILDALLLNLFTEAPEVLTLFSLILGLYISYIIATKSKGFLRYRWPFWAYIFLLFAILIGSIF